MLEERKRNIPIFGEKKIRIFFPEKNQNFFSCCCVKAKKGGESNAPLVSLQMTPTWMGVDLLEGRRALRMDVDRMA